MKQQTINYEAPETSVVQIETVNICTASNFKSNVGIEDSFYGDEFDDWE